MGKSVSVYHPSADMVEASDVPALMLQIRPAWQAKGLIDRVRRLLLVDPSSACQRLLNAAIHDLREKIQIAGLDIAKETAQANKLPPAERPEDIENYSTARIIDLSYHMGLLTRPEWRRLTRAYDIRRDLEHEDAEYEAGIEDVIYIFKTSIEAVLSRDPVTLIRVAEVKEIIEAAGPAAADPRLIEDFERAPDTRQLEILKYLVSSARDESQPDLVRQNAFTVLAPLVDMTRTSVKVLLAKHLQEMLGRKALTELDVRIANRAGVLPYVRKAQRRAFFQGFIAQLERAGHNWRSHASHGTLLRQLDEFGGLRSIPDPEVQAIVKWLVLCYIGEPGGYGAGVHRPVFFSNSAAPIIEQLFKETPEIVMPILKALESEPDIVHAREWSPPVAARFEQLMDLVET